MSVRGVAVGAWRSVFMTPEYCEMVICLAKISKTTRSNMRRQPAIGVRGLVMGYYLLFHMFEDKALSCSTRSKVSQCIRTHLSMTTPTGQHSAIDTRMSCQRFVRETQSQHSMSCR
ncbi:hypothetical protein BIW11_03327 [Tropilaelaps mercedesae]|uniref:Uncharacterized protein n=1 Tax=Tropilaelaps mercedesae TaxID=418985 RepID=A0A1V9XNF5_9ACAR|nr:hypothetical protein BIW11_03327 [Tropilaelaps mercedesae]